MRIFVCDVRKALAAGEDEHVLARRLLAYAVAEVWGRELPPIEKDEMGKPYFPGGENMHFSLSHTRTHVLAAVSEYPVGADIETLMPVKESHKRLFSDGMLADFGYFGGWTLREAVFKLRGCGSLRSMEIRRVDGEIVTPYEGVRCAVWSMDGCAVAAACQEGELPEEVEIIESAIIYSADA